MEFSAKQIAEYIQGIIVGDENATVHTFAKIEEGMPGALSFLSNPKYTHYIYDTQSTIVLVNKDFVPEQEVKATLIKVDNAYESLAKLLTLYEMSKPKKTGIDPLAYIAPTAKIGKDVYIAPFACVADGAEIGDNTLLHPHATVGSHAKVGNNCTLYPHATVYHDCRIGNNCILHAGCVIGADGFGFAPSSEGYEKIPQIGIAIIEDDVEIGANTCVDRATMGATVIHKGVKLDNLIQIACFQQIHIFHDIRFVYMCICARNYQYAVVAFRYYANNSNSCRHATQFAYTRNINSNTLQIFTQSFAICILSYHPEHRHVSVHFPNGIRLIGTFPTRHKFKIFS